VVLRRGPAGVRATGAGGGSLRAMAQPCPEATLLLGNPHGVECPGTTECGLCSLQLPEPRQEAGL
jgi:hypothetical protein